jgi:hypothetical protein
MSSTAIAAQGTTIQIATGTGSAVAVTGVTVGNPTVIASTAHGFSNGDSITFDSGFTGANAADLNGKTFTIMFKTTNTYAVNFDSTGHTITAGTAHATANTYSNIGNARTLTGFDGSASEIDVTNLGSTAKEIRQGLVDFGQITFEADHDESDAGQSAFLSAYNSSVLKAFKVNLPNGNTAAFSGYCKKFSASLGVDQVVKRQLDVRISGAVTWT